MNKKIILVLLTVLCAVTLFSCASCKHEWAEATCTEPKKCTICGETSGDPIAHSFGDWTEIKAATCTVEGTESRSCSCGNTETRAIPCSHDIVSHDGKDATCTQKGYKPYVTCKNCDYTTYEETAMKKHDITSHTGKKSTCTEAGYDPYITCKNCDYSTYKALPLAKHEYSTVVTEPTCTNIGYTTYTCKNCGHSYKGNEVKKTGHSFGNWFVSTPITNKSNGEMTRTCLNCMTSETRAPKAVETGALGYGKTPTNTATYTIYEDGTLKVVGQGELFDAGWNGANQPFKARRSEITRIVIGEGITAVGGGTFAYLENLTECELPSTLTKLKNNVFMDSFKSGITSFTIPKSVEYIGACIIGQYNSKNALFTDVYIENPNITINDKLGDTYRPFNAAKDNSKLTLYSYGENNNVSAYAKTFGYKYVDLNKIVTGTADNLKYFYFNGTLTLSPVDPLKPTVLPSSKPWSGKINASDIRSIVISDNISDIPAEYFMDHTSLTSVSLPSSIRTVGARAFAVSATCNTALTVNIPEKATSVASDIFLNRTSVTVTGFKGTAAESIDKNGVTFKLLSKFRILLLGNSLSLDAADCTSANTPSKLYEILKSMLGDDVYVQIGVLYSGAKTAGWHATVAELDSPSYQFYLISDDTNGKWVLMNGYTSREGLSYADWDIVTVQPYSAETATGVGSMTGDTDANPEKTTDCPLKAEKFCPLSASLPYILDHINKYCPNAKVYYYLTWAFTTNLGLNQETAHYNKMLGVAMQAVTYVGTESGKGFDALLPVGTSIHNARSTYLALLSVSGTNDNQCGLQRDNVHLSYRVGRYIASLSFAELLVPSEMRVSGYVLPDMSDSEVAGKLPKEYSEIARLCVQKMLETYKLTGDGKYGITVLKGYETDPVTKFASLVKNTRLEGFKATNEAELLEAVRAKILEIAPSDMVVTVSASNITLTSSPTAFQITVTLRFGYMQQTVSTTVNASLK